MSFERLQRALETAETWRADLARCAPETLLAAHPDLRDLLEPLLVPEPVDAEAGGAPVRQW